MTVVPLAISFGGLPVIEAKDVSASVANGELVQRTIGKHLPLELANSYHCPLGKKVGKGWLFMLRRDVEKLKSNKTYSLNMVSGTKSITFPALYFVRSYRVAMGPSHDPDSLHLVEIADKRWLAEKTAIDKSYNVRPMNQGNRSYISSTTNEGCPWTWKEVAEDIWGIVDDSILGNWDVGDDGTKWPGDSEGESEFEPKEYPENLFYNGMSAWDALNDVVTRIGAAVRYDPIEDKFDIIQMGGVTVANEDERDFLNGGSIVGEAELFPAEGTQRTANDLLMEDEESHGSAYKLPFKVSVAFPANYAHCGEAYITNPVYVQEVTADSVRITLGNTRYHEPLSEENTPEDTEIVIHDSLHARFAAGDESTPINDAELQERAEQIAQDYYRIQVDMVHGRWVYSGVKNYKPGPFVSEVRYRAMADGMKTEVLREPVTFEKRMLFNQRACDSSGGTTTTLNPAQEAGCEGTCIWRWDAGNEEWVVVESDCREREEEEEQYECTTTTTTTDPESSTTTTDAGSSTTTTTSTTEPACACEKPPRCGLEPGEEIETFCVRDVGEDADCEACREDCTWEWDDDDKIWERSDEDECTDEGCDCMEPQFCGSGLCTVTKTQCVQGSGNVQPFCGQSTTTTTAAPTTTTTPEPGCSDGCTWMHQPNIGWTLIFNGCRESLFHNTLCYCPTPAGSGTNCEVRHLDCVIPTTTTCAPRCQRNCVWDWNDIAEKWIYRSGQSGCSWDCLPDGTTCRCSPPSHNGDCGDIAYTDCFTHSLTTTTTSTPPNPPTTTTPEPENCEGRYCLKRWSVSQSVWGNIYSECLDDCPCPSSVTIGLEDGTVEDECVRVPCAPESSTTTTSTTTPEPTTTSTSTTCNPCEEEEPCIMECVSGQWSVADHGDYCCGGCPEGATCIGDASEGEECIEGTNTEGGTCQTTTTTPCPECEMNTSNNAYYQCDGEDWVYCCDLCDAGLEPPDDPDLSHITCDENQRCACAATGCVSTTTTAAPTTTTEAPTTTTEEPTTTTTGAGTCLWECQGGTWTVINSDCTGSRCCDSNGPGGEGFSCSGEGTQTSTDCTTDCE